MDCHGAGEGWTFNSLIPEELDRLRVRRAERVDGVHASTSRSGVDAALFVGMHAMAGTRDGVLAHTVSGSSWWRLRFNGVEVGETGINAALCGAWNCPVVLVTGDEAACREGRKLLGEGVTTAAVKKGFGRFSARQFPASRARELIEDGARKAVENRAACRAVRPGLALRDPRRFQHSDHVEKYRYRAGVEITGRARSRRAPTTGGSAWRQFSSSASGSRGDRGRLPR